MDSLNSATGHNLSALFPTSRTATPASTPRMFASSSFTPRLITFQGARTGAGPRLQEATTVPFRQPTSRPHALYRGGLPIAVPIPRHSASRLPQHQNKNAPTSSSDRLNSRRELRPAPRATSWSTCRPTARTSRLQRTYGSSSPASFTNLSRTPPRHLWDALLELDGWEAQSRVRAPIRNKESNTRRRHSWDC
ncbi:hypothetical protein BS47DRAFT_1390919 [Hydnum rufescens UP504]|uniref:Uncharacterized protein n=1 Tax=Hydnum rufescens UP504 TaxID=1448309 RepID=A0A9P6B2I3_9AGAM|nr:hypothetical protein BS47DRAFT_1390919 [Hydnum rufescens UP504]